MRYQSQRKIMMFRDINNAILGKAVKDRTIISRLGSEVDGNIVGRRDWHGARTRSNYHDADWRPADVFRYQKGIRTDAFSANGVGNDLGKFSKFRRIDSRRRAGPFSSAV